MFPSMFPLDAPHHCATINGYDFTFGPCICYGPSFTFVNIAHDRYKISGSPSRVRIQVHKVISLDAIIHDVLHDLIARVNDVVFELPVPFSISRTMVLRSSWSDHFTLVNPPGLKLFMGAQILRIVRFSLLTLACGGYPVCGIGSGACPFDSRKITILLSNSDIERETLC